MQNIKAIAAKGGKKYSGICLSWLGLSTDKMDFIELAFAEFERNRISEKTKEALAKKNRWCKTRATSSNYF
ncbi:hypothetical protein [Colwellia sp. TT2012]|uniref:hypothetical protein n=1 Tax=Colwellia sp. TT2012 TaxID=1720342 RepID=UPI00070BB729|nr:hypothetical protein [Colwellia sp. TT2012]